MGTPHSSSRQMVTSCRTALGTAYSFSRHSHPAGLPWGLHTRQADRQSHPAGLPWGLHTRSADSHILQDCTLVQQIYSHIQQDCLGDGTLFKQTDGHILQDCLGDCTSSADRRSHPAGLPWGLHSFSRQTVTSCRTAWGTDCTATDNLAGSDTLRQTPCLLVVPRGLPRTVQFTPDPARASEISERENKAG